MVSGSGSLRRHSRSGLQLPELPGTQRYEGWARVDGVWRSTGTFRDPAAADLDAETAPQRGSESTGFPFPGQDFVNAVTPIEAFDPPALLLNQDLAFPGEGDFEVVITVEPEPDNSLAPFPLPVLSAIIPFDAAVTGIGTLAPLFDEEMIASGLVNTGLADITISDIPLLPLGSGPMVEQEGHFQLWAILPAATPEGEVFVAIDRFVVEGSNLRSLTTGMTIGSTSLAIFDPISTGNASFPDATTATGVFVTLEAFDDNDNEPSSRRLLDAALSGGMGALNIFSQTSVGAVSDSSVFAGGSFILDTPSDDLANPALFNDDQGISFSDRSGILTLGLPVLREGWRYEGWVKERATGITWSTGRFADPSGPDDDQMTSLSRGDDPRPGTPGREFLFDVPTEMIAAAGPGSITEIMVTVESFPDDGAGPSGFVVLQGAVSVLWKRGDRGQRHSSDECVRRQLRPQRNDRRRPQLIQGPFGAEVPALRLCG